MKAGASTKLAMLCNHTTGYLHNNLGWARWFRNGVPNIAQAHVLQAICHRCLFNGHCKASHDYFSAILSLYFFQGVRRLARFPLICAYCLDKQSIQLSNEYKLLPASLISFAVLKLEWYRVYAYHEEFIISVPLSYTPVEGRIIKL